jgi:hypothetical protein
VYHALRQPDQALRSWEEARTALELLVRDNSCVTDFQRHLAEVYLQVGNLHGEAAQQGPWQARQRVSAALRDVAFSWRAREATGRCWTVVSYQPGCLITPDCVAISLPLL